MDTLKNFIVGLIVIVLSIIVFGVVAVAWPLLLGISSVVLSIIAVILFMIFIFYVVVLIGYAARKIFNNKSGK